MKKIYFFYFLLIPLFPFCKNQKSIKIKETCLEIHMSWLKQDLDLTKNTAGYTAPVAARSLFYISMAMAEASHWICSEFNGYSGLLNGFNLPELDLKTKTSFEHIANYVDYQIAKYFFSNSSQNGYEQIENRFIDEKNKYKKKYSRKTLKNSEKFAAEITNFIIEWSILDGGDNCWIKNFPEEYKVNYCDSCWIKTFPGYVGALQPYWGTNRLSILNNGKICNDIPYTPFSSNPESIFYKEASLMNDACEKFNDSDINTAKYWNDAPGVSGTPAGHIYSIAMNLCIEKNKDLKTCLQLFTTLGLALNDAVIECWRLKYKYNLIRPITYIQRYISKNFTTAIITPPFPEFPSGHSFQAGAGTEVLKHYFSDTIEFIDFTNESRVDINGSARKYESFSQMAEEMSISRFYGGIHYLETLRTSLNFGKKIGLNSILHTP